MRRLFALALMLLASCSAGVPEDTDNRTADHLDIVVSAQTDRTIAALDETIRFTLSVTCPQHVQLHIPEIGSLIAGLRIVDFGEIGPRRIDNLLFFEKWFDLRADLTGTYIIPAMTVRAVDHDETREIITPQIFIKVGSQSVRVDNETMQDIIDIKPPAVLPRDLRFFVMAVVFAGVLFLIGLAVWLYMRRSRAAGLLPQKPPHVLAYEQLEQLERERLVERGVVHMHYVRLSDIFRQYLQNRFAIPAVEQTTQELLRSIKNLSDLSVSGKKNTRDFLLQADLVKFAKYCPEKQNIEFNQQQVRDIIDQTRPDRESAEQPPGSDIECEGGGVNDPF